MSLQHVIATRFNCRFTKNGSQFNKFNPLSSDWLDTRFDLFERYCLPTILAQTSTNFLWFVYFDAETPQVYIDRACAHSNAFPNLRIKLCEYFSTEVLQNDIKLDVQQPCDWLLTTRLDNDDGLRSDFVLRLQREVKKDQHEALNFPYGIILSADRIYRSRQLSNAYISVSEPFSDSFVTVYSGNHNAMALRMPVRNISPEEPAWLQVIHDTNVSNKLRGARVSFQSEYRGFAPLEQLMLERTIKESQLGVMIDSLLRSRVWAARDIAARTYRRFLASQ